MFPWGEFLVFASAWVAIKGENNGNVTNYGTDRRELVVGCFHFPPFTVVSVDKDGRETRSGVEVSLVKIIAGHLGYKTVTFRSPADGRFWGNLYANGTMNGLINEVSNGMVDVGMAEYFNYVTRNRIATPSDFYHFDYFCFARAKPRPSPKWMQLFKPFQLKSWVGILACWVVEAAFLFGYAYFTGLVEVGLIWMISLSFFISKFVPWDNRR